MSDKKSKKNGKKSKDKVVSKKDKKAARLAEKAEKKKSKKGDGSFPDILVVTRDPVETRDAFTGYNGEDMSGLVNDGQTVAVYKLRKVSKVTIKRKIER